MDKKLTNLDSKGTKRSVKMTQDYKSLQRVFPKTSFEMRRGRACQKCVQYIIIKYEVRESLFDKVKKENFEHLLLITLNELENFAAGYERRFCRYLAL